MYSNFINVKVDFQKNQQQQQRSIVAFKNHDLNSNCFVHHQLATIKQFLVQIQIALKNYVKCLFTFSKIHSTGLFLQGLYAYQNYMY